MPDNTDTPKPQIEEDEEENIQPSSGINRLSEFFIAYKKGILITSTVIVGVIITGVVIYFAFIRPSDIDEFADKFCECAGEAKSDFYNESKDGFGYRSDLNGCFAEDFKAYSEYFNKVEKQEVLQQFQKKVIAKCPTKLANIFEYK
jgi:hypothetical protein